MRDVYVIGVHMTRFGKHLATGIKELAAQTVEGVLRDAGGLDRKTLQSAWFSNSAWGMREWQHCIRGQVALRPLGIDSIPIVNVENACAGGATAFHGAWKDVACGLCDLSLAVGVEKVYAPNKYMVFAGFLSGLDTGALAELLDRLREVGPPPATARSATASLAEGDEPAGPRGRQTPAGAETRSVPATGGGSRATVRAPLEEPRTPTAPGQQGARKGRSPLEEPRKPSALGRQGARKPKSPRDRLLDAWQRFTAFVLLGEALGYDTVRKLVRAGASGEHSAFMDVYAFAARKHMERYGSTQRQLAAIAAKNHWHSTMNPNAQYTFAISIEEALRDRVVSYPLTRSMCAPIGDGAAAALLASAEAVNRLGLASRSPRVLASVLVSGRAREWREADIAERAAGIAYELAGLGPVDIDLAEVHDATAFGELHQTEALGFFPKGEGGIHAERDVTRLGGSKPVNTSGGLLSRGHPIGASGLAQIHELVTQLRGEAGKRQVEGARVALAENGGGVLGNEEAALGMHILGR